VRTIPTYWVRFLILLSLILATPIHGADEEALSLESPVVINLSRLLKASSQLKTRTIPFEKIDDTTGVIELTLSRTPRRLGDPEIVSPGKKNANEEALIALNHDVVSRTEKTLTISTKTGSPFKFRDWRHVHKDADDDSQAFTYSGVIANSGLHKVDVDYQHDGPGSFLINPTSGKILYVHTSSDLTSISRNGQRILVMNNGLNPPFGIIVSALAKDGHGIELQCVGAADRKPKITPFFLGWYPDPHVGFDLLLKVQNEGSGIYEAVPVGFIQKSDGWHVSVPDPQRFVQFAKLACRQ
jgi:hypothetical protein